MERVPGAPDVPPVGLSHPTALGAGRVTIATAAGQRENAEQGVEVTLIGGACLTVCLSDGSGSDAPCLGGTVLGGDGAAGHLLGLRGMNQL